MLTLRTGVALGLRDTIGVGRKSEHAGAIEIGLGVAVTRFRHFYLLLPLQVIIGPYYTAVMFPAGIENDFKLTAHWYFCQRLSIGYALVLGYFGGPYHFGFLLPELGFKYAQKKWHLVFDLFSLPIGFGLDDNEHQTVAIYYRLMLGVGAHF